VRSPRVAAACLAALLAACDDPLPSDACPLLPAGALTGLPRVTRSLPLDDVSRAVPHAPIGPGGLLALSFHAEATDALSVRVANDGGPDGTRSIGAPLWAALYGPRDLTGGFPPCLAAGRGAPLTLSGRLKARGEYLLLVGPPSGETATVSGLSLAAASSGGPEDASGPCPTLEALGCGDVRCDGALVRDLDGCLTCTCEPERLCGPERSAGPGGACVIPACSCPEDPTSGPVCGVDGRTWPDACAAACSGVSVASPRDPPDSAPGGCEVACPAVSACPEACPGARRLDPRTGCPTCSCLDDLSGYSEGAFDPASCAACSPDPAPVCGADGLTWRNPCAARCAGVRVLYASACAPGCSRAPAGCDLDCPWGLLPAQRADGACLACQCASAPSIGCERSGGNVCADFEAFPGGPVTVGDACLALAMGASGGRWGACGQACEVDEDCGEEARCEATGYLSGRCTARETPCGCGALVDPVCARRPGDGLLATFLNLCHARCARAAVAHAGPCCDTDAHGAGTGTPEDAPGCPEGTLPTLDPRGCPAGCTPSEEAPSARTVCRTGPAAPACLEDGTPAPGSACDHTVLGLHARPELCP
jgi:hypothetical protein